MNSPKRIDLTPQQLDALLKRVEAGTLQDGDYEIIKGMAETLSFLSQALDHKNTSIKRLLKMIFGDSTEKTAKVLKRNKAGGKRSGTKKKKRKGQPTRPTPGNPWSSASLLNPVGDCRIDRRQDTPGLFRTDASGSPG